MKHRNIFAVWLGLPIITLGIYSFVWIFKIHKELGLTFPRANVTSPGSALASVIFGIVTLFIWPLIVLLNFGKSIQAAEREAGLPASFSQGLGVILTLFGFGPLYYQAELNKLATR